MDIYTTKDGDFLDAICFKHYGRQTGTTEAVLNANPGLADYPPTYPAGVQIKLPRLPDGTVIDTVRLWD